MSEATTTRKTTKLRFEQEELMPDEVSRREAAMNWVEHAACRTSDLNPDAWFPVSKDDDQDAAYAREICTTACPVQQLCLSSALRSLTIDGIWGGLDRDERRNLVRRSRRR